MNGVEKLRKFSLKKKEIVREVGRFWFSGYNKDYITRRIQKERSGASGIWEFNFYFLKKNKLLGDTDQEPYGWKKHAETPSIST